MEHFIPEGTKEAQLVGVRFDPGRDGERAKIFRWKGLVGAEDLAVIEDLLGRTIPPSRDPIDGIELAELNDLINAGPMAFARPGSYPRIVCMADGIELFILYGMDILYDTYKHYQGTATPRLHEFLMAHMGDESEVDVVEELSRCESRH